MDLTSNSGWLGWAGNILLSTVHLWLVWSTKTAT
jgi:hypothetical protein